MTWILLTCSLTFSDCRMMQTSALQCQAMLRLPIKGQALRCIGDDGVITSPETLRVANVATQGQ